MDPVTGVGLAASVIQLLTFGIDAVKTCQEVYQKGSISDYSNLDYITDHLAGLTASLQQSLQSPDIGSGALTREERDLVELARKCEDCTKILQKELDKLQTRPRASTRKAVRLAARAIWKKGTIDKINQQLQAYQSTLETSLLSRLSQRFDTQGLQNDKSFGNLDKNLQHLITCLANAQTSLNGLVVQESAQTRHCITAQIDRVETLYENDRRYEEIVNSLFYPDISSRQEQVDGQFNGIKNSYDWIFDDPQTHNVRSFRKDFPQDREYRWDDFARWLKSGHSVYWIKGKAGSGKSTLMNHICNHSRRLELLGEWCSYRRLLTPTFFFWNAGTRLQKSIDGLLRSLLYQMLKEDRELVGCFSNEPLHTWTQSRLLATLLNLLKQSEIPLAICIFIDGLDEFESQEDAVIRLISDIADQTHVKVCVSSRPLLAFEEAFGGMPSLRLQDLTFESIKEYAEIKLSEPIEKYVSHNMCESYQAKALVNKIVHRAQGVFLWAVIAIRDVHGGLRGLANINELVQTLEMLPSELESLFMTMLHRIKPAFKRDAAYFLSTAMYQGEHMYLCTLHFSHSQSEPKDRPLCYDEVATSELVVACRTLKRRLLSHTAGLLELTPDGGHQSIYAEREDHDPIIFVKINLVHRTARDFLLQNDEAKSFLTRNGASEAQVRLSIARGILAQFAHLSQGDIVINRPDGRDHIYPSFLAALQQISKAEKILGVPQQKLMQSLNYDSLACGYRVPADWDNSYGINPEPFTITGLCWISIDQVGLAAYLGMTQYICQQLDLPMESRNYPSSFPDLYNYCRSKSNAVTLAWSAVKDPRNKKWDLPIALRSSNYRQGLSKCLQWNAHAQSGSQTEAPSENESLAETYMLCCCDITCFDLAKILLRAGANPIARVRPLRTEPEFLEPDFLEPDMTASFWDRWLCCLLDVHIEHLKISGRIEWASLRDQDMKVNMTSNDVFDMTKALLANGADINCELDEWISDWISDHSHSYFKRQGLQDEPFCISLTASAMFILEECFNSELEFRHFASEIESLVKRPTRKIVKIERSSFYWSLDNDRKVIDPCPSAEESEMLWPLIERWEDTGRREDLYALQAALEGVWKAHNPGVELKEMGVDWSDDEWTSREDFDDNDENYEMKSSDSCD